MSGLPVKCSGKFAVLAMEEAILENVSRSSVYAAMLNLLPTLQQQEATAICILVMSVDYLSPNNI